MVHFTWDHYHHATTREPPVYPQVNIEYVWAYPTDWVAINPTRVWSDAPRAYYPRHYALYIHFPFCEEMCPFCTFCHTKYQDELVSSYVESLLKEIRFYAAHPLFRSVTIDAIYFGGGTPALLPADFCEPLVNCLRQSFPISEDVEVTVECNPTDASSDILGHLGEIGVNRVSFGIQTFQEHHARTLGIRSRASAGPRVVELACDVGIRNVAVDLMYGIPGQSADDLVRDVDLACSLGVGGVSLYCLDVSGSVLEHRLSAPPDFVAAREHYYAGRDRLTELGFQQQAQPDFCRTQRCRFVDTAWRAPQGGVLGLGAGAVTFFLNGWTWVNSNKIREYVQLIQHGYLPILGGAQVTKDRLMEKYPVLGFRCCFVPSGPFEDLFGVPLTAAFAEAVGCLVDSGLIVETAGGLSITQRGLWYVDNVSCMFFSPELRMCGQPWAKYLQKVDMPGVRNMSEVLLEGENL